MSNSIGTCFRLTSFGESHGPALGGVIDGCPAGLAFDHALIDRDMQRRHLGTHATTRREADKVELLSGVFEGKTLGTPIAFLIRNSDTRSDDYEALKALYRPGHADYAWQQRYGIRDWRGGGRASGRETAVRVAAGAVAKMVLQQKGFTLHATLVEAPQPAEHDSAGGIIACRIDGVPAGIGEPVFGKLNSLIAAAMMSIPSAIGIEFGAGFEAARMSGSEYRDNWRDDFTTQTNHCGGIQGGISNGMPIEFRTAFHPPVTIPQPTTCIGADGRLTTLTPQGRHDSSHVARTVVVVEAMAAMVLADLVLQQQHSPLH